MTTRLTDVVIPEVFTPYVIANTWYHSRFFNAGAIVTSDRVGSFVAGGGRTVQMPFWHALTHDTTRTANGVVPGSSTPVSDDPDPGQDLAITPFGSGKEIAPRCVRAHAWGQMDLAEVLAGDDPMRILGNEVAQWWATEFDYYGVALLAGVIADNLATDGGDMVHDVALPGSGTVADTNLISAEAILQTKQTAGDQGEGFTIIVMGSANYTYLEEKNLIDFIPDARGEVGFGTYLGYRIVVTDYLNQVTVNTLTTEYVYLMGPGTMMFGESTMGIEPTEVERRSLAGQGGGQEWMVSRRNWAMGVEGFAYQSQAIAGETPTNNEVAAAAQWDRVAQDRKQVKIAALRANLPSDLGTVVP